MNIKVNKMIEVSIKMSDIEKENLLCDIEEMEDNRIFEEDYSDVADFLISIKSYLD